MKYKRVVVDFETTGVEYEDEILQVTVIDQDENMLINEHCKPTFKTSWEEAQIINNIIPEMVKNKKPFEEYVDQLSEILLNSEQIIIYNVPFEKMFFDKYKVKYQEENKVYPIPRFYDLMLEFAEVYGDWNEKYDCYKWQKLTTCADYYGYEFINAHDALADCKATLYCYKALLNNNKDNLKHN